MEFDLFAYLFVCLFVYLIIVAEKLGELSISTITTMVEDEVNGECIATIFASNRGEPNATQWETNQPEAPSFERS